MEGWKLFSLDVACIASKHRDVEVIVREGALNQVASTNFRSTGKCRPSLRMTREWKVWSVAAAVTLLIHALLIGSLAVGSGHRSERPPLKEGFRAIDRNADGSEVVSVLFFVEEQSITTPDEQNDSA